MPQAALKSFSISMRHLLPMNELERAILNGSAPCECVRATALAAVVAASATAPAASARRIFLLTGCTSLALFRPRRRAAGAVAMQSKEVTAIRSKRGGIGEPVVDATIVTDAGHRLAGAGQLRGSTRGH